MTDQQSERSEPMTIQEFIDRDGTLKAECTPIPARPDMADEWAKDASHFHCTITSSRGAMSIQYSVGSGIVENWAKENIYIGSFRPMLRNSKPGHAQACRASWDLAFKKNNGAARSIAWAGVKNEAMTEARKYYRPELADLLDCLANDASLYDNSRDFSDFCAELGYSDDSIKARRIYDTIGEQAKQLRHLIGDEYEALLYETERL